MLIPTIVIFPRIFDNPFASLLSKRPMKSLLTILTTLLSLTAHSSTTNIYTLTVKIQSSPNGSNWSDTGFSDSRHYPFTEHQQFFVAYTHPPTFSPVPPPGKTYVAYTALTGNDLPFLNTPWQSINFVLLNSAPFYRPLISITSP